MVIQTDSGNITVNKRSYFAKWLLGWKAAGGWTGQYTLDKAWAYALKSGKPDGCSWHAYGYLMAREEQKGRDLEARSPDRQSVADVRETAEGINNLIRVDCYTIHPDCWNGMAYAGELEELNLPDDMPVCSIEVITDEDFCYLTGSDEEDACDGRRVVFTVSELDLADFLADKKISKLAD